MRSRRAPETAAGVGVAVTRDAAPLPGKTVPEVVSQLIWRVLGPLKGRAKSVSDWAGLGQAPPAVLREIGARYCVSGEAVGQRIQRVALAGVRLPLPADLEHEVIRPSRPGGEPSSSCAVGVVAGQARSATGRRPFVSECDDVWSTLDQSRCEHMFDTLG